MLEFTGERLVPGQVDPDLFNEHLARYAFAARLARNKRVLDIACGAGYGSAALARVSASVVAMDIAEDAVLAARDQYHLPNLHFLTAPAQRIPFPDHTFDLIVAFEVIEHLADWPDLLQEARRLLAPGGQFIVSTPNLAYYAETRRIAGPNPYHHHEFHFDEFRAALSAQFPSVTLFLQNHVDAICFHPASGSHILAAESAAGRLDAKPEQSHFFVAVCALTHQTGAPQYLYLPSTTNVLREREHHINKLETELQQKDAWLDDLKGQHAELHTLHQQQTAEHRKTTEWALSLDTALAQAQDRIVELQDQLQAQQAETLRIVAAYEAKINEIETELIERTTRALSLEAQLGAKVQELAACVDLLHQAEATIEERTRWAHELQQTIANLENTMATAEASRWVRLGRAFGIGPNLHTR